jgi:hypothetical protein
MKPNTIKIDDVEYVRADSVTPAHEGGMDYVIVRSRDAGVFAGFLQGRDLATQSAVLLHSRRLWFWAGAASLSELAVLGVSKPAECKFPAEIAGAHTVLGVCEIIPVTEAAKASIESVKPWTAH